LREEHLCLPGPVEFGARRLEDRACALVARHDVGKQLATLLGLQIEFLPGFALEQEITPPGREAIGPRFDGENVAARRVGDETRGPAIVVVKAHRRAMPTSVAFPPPDERGRDDLVAVQENVGPHVHRLALDPLYGVATLLDARVDVLDQEARARGVLRRSRYTGDRREGGLDGHGLIWDRRPAVQ